MLDVQVKISYDLLKFLCYIMFDVIRDSYKKGAGAKCDHHKMKVRARVRSHLNLDGDLEESIVKIVHSPSKCLAWVKKCCHV